ncbi:MAG: DUF1835 domain-containing protein, partial [Erysipelotrichaceae bacterium]|nr:DUF1835 domain-containing protein [Erysipelotrichaceae bacterium]
MEHKEQSEYIDVFFKGIDAGFYKMIMPYEADPEVFDLELSFGNISDIKDYDSRIADYRTLFPVFKDASFNEDVLNGIGRFIVNGRLDALKKTDKKIRIWASKRASDELCGLYFLCSELSDKDLYLVDIPMNGDCLFNNMDVGCYLTDSPKCLYRDLNDGYYLNFHKNIVFGRISEEKKEEYAKKWQKLVEEDGDLRTYDRGVVTTYYYEDFYETILKIVGT